jgi:hypothetical protein
MALNIFALNIFPRDEYFMATAFLASMRSKDPATQVLLLENFLSFLLKLW